MPSGLLIRLRPNSPWRIGPDSGDRDRVDRILHSDSLYSAVTAAMFLLGDGESWLDATARPSSTNAGPAVRFSSCFPFQGDALYVPPPETLWPPPASSKVRWKGARFVPISVVETLVAGKAVPEDGWMIDGPSECLVPLSMPPNPGPFRVAVRSNAAIDRAGASVTTHSTACLEFTPDSGIWTVAVFDNEEARERWSSAVVGAVRLLADSGLGGERSRGFGRAEMPEISEGQFPDLLSTRKRPSELSSVLWPLSSSSQAWWLLSLFHPAASDPVDWTHGSYSLTTRLGRVESSAGWGDPKKATRMVTEGSVLVAPSEPRGSATDVAPEGFPHPVYRNGFALAIPIPYKTPS